MKLWHHYTGSSSKAAARRRVRKIAVDRAVGSVLEPLETRRLYSVSAVSAGGVLTVTGDNAPNVITVSRDDAGTLLVNGGAVHITGPAPTVANTTLIEILGQGGNDRLSLDETHGALPSAHIDGGAGNDVLTGGSGADSLDGGDGYDVLNGQGGADVLHGDAGNDLLIGGPGADQAFGDAGNDRMVWNPGDGSDVNEGGDGNDTVIVNGGDVGETFTAAATAGSRVLFQRTSPGPFSVDIGTSENLVLNANGGDDSFDGSAVPAGLMSFTINGGDGNDTLLGTGGVDQLNGDAGNDLVDGNGGADVAHLGAGDDVFRWDPGDGSDVVEGQAGHDLMLFNGSGGDENIDLSANGHRLRFFRDAGNITMDVNDTEAVQFNAVGGQDKIIVHNLRATDVREVDLNLGRAPGSGKVDSVVVEGSNYRDFFDVSGRADGRVSVASQLGTVNITGAEPTDTLAVNALGGNDVIEAAGLPAGLISFSADGGHGNDIIIGSAGDDTLLGNAGNDLLVGGPGQDSLDGGAGHNIVIQ